MFKELFGCCNQLIPLNLYQLKSNSNNSFRQGRTSRFLQVTTDPLHAISRKASPDMIKKNKTLNSQANTRYDTRGSDNNQEVYGRIGREKEWKPRTPIMDLEMLMESRVKDNQGNMVKKGVNYY